MPSSSFRSDRTGPTRPLALLALVCAFRAGGAVACVAEPAALLPPAGLRQPAVPAAPLPPTSAGIAPCVEEWLLAVVVNGEPMAATIVLADGGRVWVRSADLARWRFAPSRAPPLLHDGEAFLRLDLLAGVRGRIDAATQTLHVDTVAANFVGTVAGGDERGRAEATRATPGAFLDYDVSIESHDRRTRAGGLFEAVGFGPWGTFAGSAVARTDLRRGVAADSGSSAGIGINNGNDTGRGVVRLDTTWTLDRPDARSSWRAGDLFGRSGSDGAPVRMAGLQSATNFATEPGFVTFPLPSFAGEAAVPSTIDLYVDDALRMRRSVPAGPFTVPELPVVTGSGEARVVVRDLLGRQQTIVAPFYASARLLRAGLRDFSYEVGALRQGYGVRSNDYGELVALGSERRGFSDTFTGEAHAELARRRQALGVGAVWLWPEAGVFSAALAASFGHGDAAAPPDGRAAPAGGVLGTVGFERQSATFNVGGSISAGSSGYRPLGRDDSRVPRQTSQLYLSRALGEFGSLGGTYVRRRSDGQESVELVGATYSVALGRLGQISLTLLRDMRRGDGSASFGFSTSLGADTSLNAGATTQRGSRSESLQVQRNLPPGEGVGYRLAAFGGDAARAEADLRVQGDHGRLDFDVALGQGGSLALRGGAAGAVVLLGGHVFASRAIGDGFAVVEVPGFEGVRVYAANQLVARTGADGAALVPRLLPYQRNAIRIEQADLPLDTTIGSNEGEVVPFGRGGVLLPFPVRRARGGLLTVLLDDGLPVPAGALATLAGAADAFPAGQHGELYLSDLAASNVVELVWRAQRCRFAVSFVATADPLPSLGTFVCHGVAR